MPPPILGPARKSNHERAAAAAKADRAPDVAETNELSNADVELGGWTAKSGAKKEAAPVVRVAGKKLDTENDYKHDGALLGGDGLPRAGDTPFSSIVPVLPNNGATAGETIVFINGIMTDVAMHKEDLQVLANTGAAVVGIHNATRGMALDLLQCIGDKFDLRMANNGAVTTASNVIYDTLKQGKPLTLLGHSQGALILSRAVSDVQRRLMLEDGLSTEDAKAKLASIKVETLGGAAMQFPDGPSYTHFVNKYDLIGQATGVGIDKLNPFGKMGDGARVVMLDRTNAPSDMPPVGNGFSNYFARFFDRTVHGTVEVYFKDREPK